MISQSVLGQHSYRIASDLVEAWVTHTGGHVAPVTFQLSNRTVQPLSVAPWGEERPLIPPILQVLRGDFFCCPFGSNDEPFGSEQYPIHGETANRDWQVEVHNQDGIEMSLDLSVRPGDVVKQVWVKPGQTAFYQRNTIRNMSGPMCFGQHAMVKFNSPGLVSVGPFGFGQVFPGQFEDPVIGGYSSLKPGVRFESLSDVPFGSGGSADLTRYPAREGFEDLAMVYAVQGATFGWTAVTFPEEGYIWYSLKDPRVLSGTILWHSNGGRHYAPWSSRHRAVLGLEEVTSYMHYGLAGSVRPNPAQEEGYRTYFEMSPDQPLSVNAIIGVVECGLSTGAVIEIVPVEGGIQILTADGGSFSVQVDVDELYAPGE